VGLQQLAKALDVLRCVFDVRVLPALAAHKVPVGTGRHRGRGHGFRQMASQHREPIYGGHLCRLWVGGVWIASAAFGRIGAVLFTGLERV
jgi:hypothetical protein